MLPRLYRGSRTEAAAAASCELFAGISGHHLRWKTAPDKQRPFLHLVIAGSSLRATSHTGMGIVDDFAVAVAKADSAPSRVWIRRSRHKGKAKRVISTAAEGTAKPSACISAIERRGGMARDPSRQESSLTKA